MILEALKSSNEAALITLMLEKDLFIFMDEDSLIVVASNFKAATLIFRALHEKGRIEFGNSTIEAARAPSAKRLKIASDPSLLARRERIRSVVIVKNVIKVAGANADKEQRLKLQFLFQKWDVLSDEDSKLFYSTDELPSSSS